MDTILINSGNSRTLIILDYYSILQINLKSDDKYVALSNLSMYYIWKNIKKFYKNNKFKKSAPVWNDIFKLPDESNFVSNIQYYFEYIIKNMKQCQQ